MAKSAADYWRERAEEAEDREADLKAALERIAQTLNDEDRPLREAAGAAYAMCDAALKEPDHAS